MNNKAIRTLAAAAAMTFMLSACDNDGPAEEAGEHIDQAVEQAGDKIENATD